eukprot:CAMPEP_0201651124 /NCGR_PEP_ID=MMETSP0493-20130528/42477_1 /ASSEMBLY_ACC=CAM_ASM_000838 /TAXON_ID=420259 /ORGANISM="Thalassiosira gravida, Strain GMp14c1" /LENGTH=86 /DNA_ID=CAMNT_0048127397 /DNA_START=45 /DNA_END=301 /DNA_ORIENTATION=-
MRAAPLSAEASDNLVFKSDSASLTTSCFVSFPPGPGGLAPPVSGPPSSSYPSKQMVQQSSSQDTLGRSVFGMGEQSTQRKWSVYSR